MLNEDKANAAAGDALNKVQRVSENKLDETDEPVAGITIGGPSGLLTVVRTGGEPVRCTIELEESHSIVRVEAGGEEVCGFLIEGSALTPEVVVRQTAGAHNGTHKGPVGGESNEGGDLRVLPTSDTTNGERNMTTKGQLTSMLNAVSGDAESGRVTLRRHATPLAERIEEHLKAFLAEEQLAQKLLATHEETLRSVERKGWLIEEVEGVGEDHLHVEAFVRIEAFAELRDEFDERYRVYYRLAAAASDDRWTHTVERGGYGFRCSTPSGNIMSLKTALRLLDEDWETKHSPEIRELWDEFASECGPGEEPDREEFKRVLEKYRRGELSGERRDAGGDSFGYDDFVDQDDDEVFVIDLESSDEH